jgi:hypothetical protein
MMRSAIEMTLTVATDADYEVNYPPQVKDASPGESQKCRIQETQRITALDCGHD